MHFIFFKQGKKLNSKWRGTAAPAEEHKLQRAKQKKRVGETNRVTTFLLKGGFLFKSDLKSLMQCSLKGLSLVAQGVHP